MSALPPWPRSLQGRLLGLVLLLGGAVWGVAAWLTWRDARHELDELLDGHLAQAAAVLVAQQLRDIEDHGDRERRGHDDDDRPTAESPQLHRYAPQVAFQVWHEGRLVLRSANAPRRPLAGERSREGFTTVEHDGRRWRVFATRGAERDIRVHVGEQAATRREILLALLRGLVAPLALALPILALALWWAVRHGTAPLRELGRTLAARMPHSLAPVTLDDAPTEMQPMLDALNALFARIEAMLAAERRFTADAAHEMRTPIAAIRAQAQVALREADDAARRRALELTLQGCDRAAHLVEQLLTLSRLESGAAPSFALCDLVTTTRQVAAELAPAALARGRTISLDAGSTAIVRGNATLLAVLVRNLLDNAVRYARAGGSIEIAVQAADTGTVLRVEDDGPGLDDAGLARLGERFFRVLGTEASGSGLGWSIVRRIAEAHGADVRAGRSARLGGLEVVVRWPPVPVAGQ